MKHSFLLPLAVLGILFLTSAAPVRVACVGDGAAGYAEAAGSLLGSDYEVRSFTRDAGLKGFAPDIVTIMLGAEDSKAENWNGEKFRAAYEERVKGLWSLSPKPRIIILTPTPAWDNQFGVRDSVIRHCILSDIRWLVKRLDLETADLYDPFKNRPELFPDGVHPNDEAVGKMGVIVAAACLKPAPESKDKGYIPPVEQDVRDNIAAWQDLKFGMFIHWGTYSQTGVVESWSICPENVDWQYKARPQDKSYFEYVESYEALQTTFNPVDFDPDEWAEAAKYAGMKYVVFTTKHHDGFTMYDTQYSDYKVTSPRCAFSSDPRADIARTLVEAYRRKGLMTGLYYSVSDWHHDDFWWKYFPPKDRHINYDTAKFPEKWPRFQDFIVNQVDELTSGKYGDIPLMWFDLCNVSNGSYAPVPWERMAEVMRRNRPGIMMVARHTHTVYENYRTPEQAIPDDVLDYPWESCITMSQSWSWRRNPVYKPTSTLLGMLVRIVARGGNLLLNVGPAPDGRLDAEAYERLREIGDWMRVNSEGIYGTKPLKGLKGDDRVFYTSKNGSLYAFFIPPKGESLPETLFLPGVCDASKAVMLGVNGRCFKLEAAEGGMNVHIPSSVRKNLPCEHIWCIKLDLQH